MNFFSKDDPSIQDSPQRIHLAEERVRVLIDSVRDYAIFMLRTDGTIATWNLGAATIKGYAAEEIIGRHISAFYPPEDVAAGRPQKLLAEAALAGRVEDLGWRVRKDGTRFWADVVITATYDGDGRLGGYVKVTRDLTDRKQAEEERIRLTQANEAIRLRDEFLSIASHELKTPLTAVQLQIDSIIRHMEVDEQLQVRLQRAARSLRRLDGLIGSLLDVARISTGRFTLALEQTNLTATISEAAERLRDAAIRTGSDLVLELQPGIEAEVDPLRVEQVVSNLLSNALRYAEGKPVCVRLMADAAEAVLEVQDRGPGIPADKMHQIFERFERAASDTHVTGLGLGLFVTREIAVAHGGSVAARNGEGGGAIFTVRLPLRRPATAGD